MRSSIHKPTSSKQYKTKAYGVTNTVSTALHEFVFPQLQRLPPKKTQHPVSIKISNISNMSNANVLSKTSDKHNNNSTEPRNIRRHDNHSLGGSHMTSSPAPANGDTLYSFSSRLRQTPVRSILMAHGCCFDFFEKGDCRSGSECKYSHLKPGDDRNLVMNTEDGIRKKRYYRPPTFNTYRPGSQDVICFTFARKGWCIHGDQCWNKHITNEGGPSPTGNAAEGTKPLEEVENVIPSQTSVSSHASGRIEKIKNPNLNHIETVQLSRAPVGYEMPKLENLRKTTSRVSLTLNQSNWRKDLPMRFSKEPREEIVKDDVDALVDQMMDLLEFSADDEKN